MKPTKLVPVILIALILLVATACAGGGAMPTPTLTPSPTPTEEGRLPQLQVHLDIALTRGHLSSAIEVLGLPLLQKGKHPLREVLG